MMRLQIVIMTIFLWMLTDPSDIREGFWDATQFNWHDETEQEEFESERTRRVAILFDCSLSMEFKMRAGETRRERALVELTRLLQKLPKNTDLFCVGFNERPTLAPKLASPLGARNRDQAFAFARQLVPRGDTLPADCLAVVLRRHPKLDAVFLVTDARAPNRRVAKSQALALAELQRRFGVTVHWVIVDPLSRRELAAMLRLAGGRLHVAK
ncbi:MAG: vWA domain-containing protein [Pirellulaceae bacterium]|nr:VWA domain-containing protein [Planctomycetaceae bacterium]